MAMMKLSFLLILAIAALTPRAFATCPCTHPKPTPPTKGKPTPPTKGGPILPPVPTVPLPPVPKLPLPPLPPVPTVPLPPVPKLPLPPLPTVPLPPVPKLPLPPLPTPVPKLPLPPVPIVTPILPPVPVITPILPPVPVVTPVHPKPSPKTPPVHPKPSPKTPPGTGCPPGPPKKKPAKCPINVVKLGACLDVLGHTIHIGDPKVDCCPLIAGLTSEAAALCLCTSIKTKVLGLKIFVPIAVELLITCGKTPPPGYNCA